MRSTLSDQPPDFTRFAECCALKLRQMLSTGYALHFHSAMVSFLNTLHCHLETVPGVRVTRCSAAPVPTADRALLRIAYWELPECCELVRKGQTGSVWMPKKKSRVQKGLYPPCSRAVASCLFWADVLNTACFTWPETENKWLFKRRVYGDNEKQWMPLKAVALWFARMSGESRSPDIYLLFCHFPLQCLINPNILWAWSTGWTGFAGTISTTEFIHLYRNIEYLC